MPIFVFIRHLAATILNSFVCVSTQFYIVVYIILEFCCVATTSHRHHALTTHIRMYEQLLLHFFCSDQNIFQPLPHSPMNGIVNVTLLIYLIHFQMKCVQSGLSVSTTTTTTKANKQHTEKKNETE